MSIPLVILLCAIAFVFGFVVSDIFYSKVCKIWEESFNSAMDTGLGWEKLCEDCKQNLIKKDKDFDDLLVLSETLNKQAQYWYNNSLALSERLIQLDPKIAETLNHSKGELN